MAGRLLELIGGELGIRMPDRLGAARLALAAGLRDAQADGRGWLLVVDETQRAGEAVRQELQVLSNGAGRPGGFDAVILLGRTELVRELSRPRPTARLGRVGLHLHLPPMDLSEAREFLLLELERRPAEMELEALHRDAMGNPWAIRRLAEARFGDLPTAPRGPASSRRIESARPPRASLTDEGPAAVWAPQSASPAGESAAAPSIEAVAPRPPSLIPARPPIRLEDGLVEVGWEGDMEEEPSRAEPAPAVLEADPDEGTEPHEQRVEDRYAAPPGVGRVVAQPRASDARRGRAGHRPGRILDRRAGRAGSLPGHRLAPGTGAPAVPLGSRRVAARLRALQSAIHPAPPSLVGRSRLEDACARNRRSSPAGATPRPLGPGQGRSRTDAAARLFAREIRRPVPSGSEPGPRIAQAAAPDRGSAILRTTTDAGVLGMPNEFLTACARPQPGVRVVADFLDEQVSPSRILVFSVVLLPGKGGPYVRPEPDGDSPGRRAHAEAAPAFLPAPASLIHRPPHPSSPPLRLASRAGWVASGQVPLSRPHGADIQVALALPDDRR